MDNITDTINKCTEQLKGLDSLIPPIPNESKPYQPTHSESGSSYIIPEPENKDMGTIKYYGGNDRSPLFTDGFWDCTLSLCLFSGIALFGYVLGRLNL